MLAGLAVSYVQARIWKIAALQHAGRTAGREVFFSARLQRGEMHEERDEGKRQDKGWNGKNIGQ